MSTPSDSKRSSLPHMRQLLPLPPPTTVAVGSADVVVGRRSTRKHAGTGCPLGHVKLSELDNGGIVSIVKGRDDKVGKDLLVGIGSLGSFGGLGSFGIVEGDGHAPVGASNLLWDHQR